MLLILSTVGEGNNAATIYLAGYEPTKGIGGPPQLEKGRAIISSDEIVLDQAFASKYGYKVEDTVTLSGCQLRLVGISSGTNAFVIQYAFVNLERAWQLAGYSGIVTCFLVNLDSSQTAASVIGDIQRLFPRTKAFKHDEFVQNNLREMQAGFLPFIYTLSALGTIVLTSILSLLLSISIIERRRDFAVMKALGAPAKFLLRLVVGQALITVGLGTKIAIVFLPLLAGLIHEITPEVAIKLSFLQIVEVATGAVFVGVVSALIAMSRLRRIYAMEAF